MKRTLLLVVLLAGLAFTAKAQDQDLTVKQIRDEWPKASIVVPTTNGKIGIQELALGVARAFRGEGLMDELRNYLEKPGYENEDVNEYVMDPANGYCSIDFVSDATVIMEMCYWNLPDKGKLVAVKMFNYYEDEQPLLMLYRYDPEDSRLNPDLDNTLLEMVEGYDSIILPQSGTNIELWNQDADEPVVIFYQGNGVFSAPKTVERFYCFVADEGVTNIRNAPKGQVVYQLKDTDIYMLFVFNPDNGWWQVYNGAVYVMDEADPIHLPTTEAWIHSSVLGVTLRNYDGKPEPLYASPDATSQVVGHIDEQEALVRPVDLAAGGAWIKVRHGKLTGWIPAERLCDNPVSTCP